MPDLPDLDEIEDETLRLLEQSYRNDGLARTEVLWLVNQIIGLLKHARGGEGVS